MGNTYNASHEHSLQLDFDVDTAKADMAVAGRMPPDETDAASDGKEGGMALPSSESLSKMLLSRLAQADDGKSLMLLRCFRRPR